MLPVSVPREVPCIPPVPELQAAVCGQSSYTSPSSAKEIKKLLHESRHESHVHPTLSPTEPKPQNRLPPLPIHSPGITHTSLSHTNQPLPLSNMCGEHPVQYTTSHVRHHDRRQYQISIQSNFLHPVRLNKPPRNNTVLVCNIAQEIGPHAQHFTTGSKGPMKVRLFRHKFTLLEC